MNIEEIFANAEDKGRLTAEEFLDKMRTDYAWQVIHNPSTVTFLELYIDEPEGLSHYLPPDFLEMDSKDLQNFFDEFNEICGNHLNFKAQFKDTNLGSDTPQP